LAKALYYQMHPRRGYRDIAGITAHCRHRGIRSLTRRELIAVLNRDGCFYVRQTGSHQPYAHADGRRVTVAPDGRGETFTIRTLQ